jgi:hypothetical protein
MPEETAFRKVVHKACGCDEVTMEYKDLTTYRAVYVAGRDDPYYVDDESKTIGDADETGLWCPKCEEYLDPSECDPGDEYEPDESSFDAAVRAHMAIEHVLDRYAVSTQTRERLVRVMKDLEQAFHFTEHSAKYEEKSDE